MRERSRNPRDRSNRERHQGRRVESESLRRQGERLPGNCIYGVLPVTELLRANPQRVESITIAEGVREGRFGEIIELARTHGLIIKRSSREAIDKMVEPGANHQGVAAAAAAADYSPADELFEGLDSQALTLVLDGVEDPRNFGAIVRTAECAGVSSIFIPSRRAVGITQTVVKSSVGATEHVKIAKVANVNRLIEELKARNVWVVGTAVEGAMDYTEWDWTQPTALVLGGEGRGLHRLVAENCDALVKIPMYGTIESLNVSVAAGVILFEAQRQRRKTTNKVA
ncbi:MAG: 23S rRNA (guanosine(2251)-2'-O)-methyltransferase RlmB [Blastocatellia bacterium]|nr:23S rRNA (guanosine(2251)-2'-O)-methyltransferase RlmB [Blastocatellia bacterium]